MVVRTKKKTTVLISKPWYSHYITELKALVEIIIYGEFNKNALYII